MNWAHEPPATVRTLTHKSTYRQMYGLQRRRIIGRVGIFEGLFRPQPDTHRDHLNEVVCRSNHSEKHDGSVGSVVNGSSFGQPCLLWCRSPCLAGLQGCKVTRYSWDMWTCLSFWGPPSGPANSAACRAGACPIPALSTLPIITSHTSPDAIPERGSIS